MEHMFQSVARARVGQKICCSIRSHIRRGPAKSIYSKHVISSNAKLEYRLAKSSISFSLECAAVVDNFIRDELGRRALATVWAALAGPSISIEALIAALPAFETLLIEDALHS
jgi:hypothetical protein